MVGRFFSPLLSLEIILVDVIPCREFSCYPIKRVKESNKVSSRKEKKKDIDRYPPSGSSSHSRYHYPIFDIQYSSRPIHLKKKEKNRNSNLKFLSRAIFHVNLDKSMNIKRI